MEKSRAFFAAKKHGTQANAQILTRFEKEFLQRTISGQGAFNSGFIIANGGFQTDILRSQRANISSSFLRRYETRCQPIQGSSSASTLLSNVIYTPPLSADANDGACLRALDCPQGTFPEIAIRSIGNSDIQATTLLPNGLATGNFSVKKNAIGHCMLVKPMGNNIEVSIDSVYYDSRTLDPTRPISIISTKRLVPLGNVAGVRLLP